MKVQGGLGLLGGGLLLALALGFGVVGLLRRKRRRSRAVWGTALAGVPLTLALLCYFAFG